MSNMVFTEKFIGFLDILGFKGLVDAAEAGDEKSLTEALHVLTEFGSPKHRTEFAAYGPKMCPESERFSHGLDFRATHISDCLVVSAEISPAGAINLIQHCWAVVLRLLQKGKLCRGYITRGRIFHTDTQFVGTGYQEAYQRERGVTAFKRQADERGTPFVEVDGSVCDYIQTCKDSCVKEMFSRMVKGDGEVEALFPFQSLQHSFVIGDFWGHKFNAEKEKQSNRNVRGWLTDMRKRVLESVDDSNPSARRKVEHYVRALDAQLAVCDSTDEFLNSLTSQLTHR